MKLTSKEALQLLKSGVVKTDDELQEERNKWVLHSICVGDSARIIAHALGIDEDYAAALGYIHDIGRKISHPRHVIEGYHYMLESGYPEEASICLTHSFINNNIHLVAGGEVKAGDTRDFIEGYLNNRDLSLYDNIIQMCDLLCLPTGITTLERRLLDIYSRKGIHSNTLAHYENALRLKSKLESLLGCSLYSLFDTLSEEDIKNAEADTEAINRLLSDNKVSVLRK